MTRPVQARCARRWPAWLASLLVGSVLGLTLSPLSRAQDTPAQPDVAQVLRDPRYEFCHPDWHVRPSEGDLCRFASDARAACPGFAQACANAPAPERGAEPQAGSAELLRSLALLAQGLFWLLLVAGVLWLLLQIVRNLRSGAEREARTEEPGTEGLPAVPAPAPKLVDADALRLLNGARSAASAGDLILAAQLAHAALVRALERGGHLRADASMSNGDYARALADAPVLHDAFRAVAREVERTEFSGRAPTAEAVQQILSRVEPIVHRLVALLLVVGTAFATGCQLEGGRATDHSPRGGSVLVRLLEQAGSYVERRLEPLSTLSSLDADLLIIQPSGALPAADWPAIEAWVASGGSLVVVGTRPQLSEQLGSSQSPVRCKEPARLAFPQLVPGGSRLVGLERAVEPGVAWVRDVSCGAAAVIASRIVGSGRIVLIAEEDFTSNASLAAADHARVLLALLGSAESVQIVDRLTGAGAESPYRAISKSGLGPLLAHGLAWLVLWALAAGTNFGTPRDPVSAPRRALAEHIRAVARCYERAGASRHALASYATWALERLHARLSPGTRPHGRELVSTIARATRRSEAEVEAVLAAATAARHLPQGPNQPAADLATIAKLGELVRETGGKR